MERIDTLRLNLRPIHRGDVVFLRALWSDERVMVHLGGVRSPAEVDRTVDKSLNDWRLVGVGRWITSDCTGPIGTVKLGRCEIAGRQEIELGYAFAPQAWGCGYATEAAEAVLRYARDRMGLHQVVAFAVLANTSSFAVMDRLGFMPEKTFERPAGTHRLFRKTL